MTNESSQELERKLKAAQQREAWEAEHPEAIGDAFARGRQEGWSQGWRDALLFAGQWTLHCADLQRTTVPEPMEVSFEKIAAFLEQHRTGAQG